MSVSPLQILRQILRADYLTAPDWERSVQELALLAQKAFSADAAFVAFYQVGSGWTATGPQGEQLRDHQIRLLGSRSVLEHVRVSHKPLLTTRERPLLLRSESLESHRVQSVLAVPLRFVEPFQADEGALLYGCLYAHREHPRAAFQQEDIELMLDLAELGQRSLNLLHILRGTQARLEASQARVEQLESAEFQLGSLRTRDAEFAREVLGSLRHAARAQKVNILFLGPTGSGKSHLARLFHQVSSRASGPFVVLDCSQITSAETLAAELFGYAPHSGYANSPREGRAGKAALAHGGTLFIDEVSAIPPELQARLLRLLQEGALTPLGGNREEQVDIQVLAATNEILGELVRRHRFREDLYWRLSELVIQLPSLEERSIDIPDLARGFFQRARDRFGRKELQEISPAALEELQHQPWSRLGNIRGLEQTLHRAVLLAPPGTTVLGPGEVGIQPLAGLEPSRPLGSRTDLESAGHPSSQAQEAPGIPSILGLNSPPQTPGSPSSGALSAKTQSLNPPTEEDLQDFLHRKFLEHRGVSSHLAQDPEVAEVLGYSGGSVPISSLNYRISRLGLRQALLEARQQHEEELSLPRLRKAIRQYGSGNAAARALGISRDAISWKIRKAGLTIRQILREPTP